MGDLVGIFDGREEGNFEGIREGSLVGERVVPSDSGSDERSVRKTRTRNTRTRDC